MLLCDSLAVSPILPSCQTRDCAAGRGPFLNYMRGRREVVGKNLTLPHGGGGLTVNHIWHLNKLYKQRLLMFFLYTL